MTNRAAGDDVLRDPAVRAFVWAVLTLVLLVCRTPAAGDDGGTTDPGASAGQNGVTLATDSTQYTVRFVDGLYRVTIGYRYTNRSGNAVSANHCRTPVPPVLEKRVGEWWVRAYSHVSPACLSHPPFRIAGGETYRGTLPGALGRRGGNWMPQLEVDSIPGTYRLRWVLTVGDDPEAPGARPVEAVSNGFRLVER